MRINHAALAGAFAMMLLSVTTAAAHDAGTGCSHDHATSRIICNDSDNHFVGTGDRDKVQLLAGDDRGDGFGGNDLIYGGPGSDKIQGSGGVDNIYGQKGNDTINGGKGADDLYDGDNRDPVDDDNLCAGRDRAVDYLDAKDGDTSDILYIDRGEDNFERDVIATASAVYHDRVLPAADCPLPD